jgi:hypothetical protein
MRTAGGRFRTFWHVTCLSLACTAIVFLFHSVETRGTPRSTKPDSAERRVSLGVLHPGSLYGITVSVKNPVAI